MKTLLFVYRANPSIGIRYYDGETEYGHYMACPGFTRMIDAVWLCNHLTLQSGGQHHFAIQEANVSEDHPQLCITIV